MCSRSTLVLVRHAAVDGTRNGQAVLCGRYDAPLSAAGVHQVNCLRRRLAAGPSFDRLFSSPLQRAVDTAEAAPAPLFHSLRTLDSLAEIDCGRLDGLPIEDVRRSHPGLWDKNESEGDEDFSWPGGESYRRFRKRVLRAITAIVRAHPKRRLLIVTHAGVINQILGSIAGQSAARWKNFRPRNASLTQVSWDCEVADVETFDDCAHLEL